MRCRSALTRIDALRTGELEPAESGEVHEHLKTCRSCDESVADVVGLARAVKSCAVEEPPRSCRDAMTDRFEVFDVNGVRVWVAFSDRGLTMIHADGSDEQFRERYASRFAHELCAGSLPDRLRRQVVAALSGEGVAKPIVDLGDATDFEKSVLQILTEIPRGEVRSYSWVARQAGRPGAVRAVGSICARNILPFVVPCHRVVPATGGVGNYAFGEQFKRTLLSREGVAVEELDEQARTGIRYIGSRTTHIFCVPTCRDARRIREENRVAFRGEDQAAEKGFRPCRRCQPVAA